jgi:hypothetical protein
MATKKPQNWRKRNIVGQFDADGKMVRPQVFESINAAKRESRSLQKGALGLGSLTVIRR